MTARMRRLASDWEKIKKDFAGHKNIVITPVGEEPPERYHVTYFVNGVYAKADGNIEILNRHEVEITLHAEYPRYKPLCKILTPIWHPNFRDGQICIGDIWGAGESLSDIIINIGDMIQYKSWNSYSPLSADAAKWAMENRHMFPVGNVDLYTADYGSAKDSVEIDLFAEEGDETIAVDEEPTTQSAEAVDEIPTTQPAEAEVEIPKQQPKVYPSGRNYPQNPVENDFEITAEDLVGVEFIPTAQRMQTLNHGPMVKSGKINFKTVLVKGLLWALIGAFIGFFVSEYAAKDLTNEVMAAKLCGHDALVEYFELSLEADELWKEIEDERKDWCKENDVDFDDEDAISLWFESGDMSEETIEVIGEYLSKDEEASYALYDAYVEEYDEDDDELQDAIQAVIRTKTGLWTAAFAVFIGLFLGLGEGIFYGSWEKALKYAMIGAVISLLVGYLSGYLAQYMYAEMLEDDPTEVAAAFVRGIAWAVMGLGIGLAIGLIKPQVKRIVFCGLGGLGGGFIGGFLFDYICKEIPNDVVARGAGLVIMGLLIGVGVGLLEQFAKQAWLKVIRGEFEGKEYLVFAGTTSIGNNAKNTIVLFKDKLVGPHHCDIRLEGNRYVLIDAGTPLGTVVNGSKISRHVLRKGDAIAVGNSVLVFHTK